MSGDASKACSVCYVDTATAIFGNICDNLQKVFTGHYV